jgi:hypothetical protein
LTKKTSPSDGEPGKRRGLFDAIQSAMKDTHRWRPIEGVVAVHSSSDGPDLASTLHDTRLANTVSPVARSLFAEAGWHFVNAEDSRAGSDAHEVLIDRDGQLKIVGSTIDVKFRSDVSSESIHTLLEDCGLTMVESYDFSKNLFSVRGDRILEKAIKLNSLEDVEFAEPSLIESISRT